MCAGALLLARVAALVWGAPNVRAGADGSWVTLLPQGSPAAAPLLLPPDRAEPGLGSGSGYGQAGARDGRAAACADQAAEICNGSGSAAGTGQSVAARDGRSQAEPVSTGAARDAACSGSRPPLPLAARAAQRARLRGMQQQIWSVWQSQAWAGYQAGCLRPPVRLAAGRMQVQSSLRVGAGGGA